MQTASTINKKRKARKESKKRNARKIRLESERDKGNTVWKKRKVGKQRRERRGGEEKVGKGRHEWVSGKR